jgi:hypothetical protein
MKKVVLLYLSFLCFFQINALQKVKGHRSPRIYRISYFIFLLVILSCGENSTFRSKGQIQIINAQIGTSFLNAGRIVKNVSNNNPVNLLFTSAVDTNSLTRIISVRPTGGISQTHNYTSANNFAALNLAQVTDLQYSTNNTLAISSTLRGVNGVTFPGVRFQFTAQAGSMVIDSISLNGKTMTTSVSIDPKKTIYRLPFRMPVIFKLQTGVFFHGACLIFNNLK